MAIRLRQVLRGRGLLSAVGALVIALALAGPMFLPRSGARVIGPWLPMGRILEPDHGHHRDGGADPPYGHSAVEPGPRRPYGGRQSLPSGRTPWFGQQRAFEPRIPGHVRRSHAPHHGHGGFNPWHHLQCKVFHRHC
jgi:hypothetical protein